MSPSLSQAAVGLSIRLMAIIESLCQAVAAHAGRNRAAAPMVLLVWPYLRRIARRFDSLARRLQTGRANPAPPRSRAPSPSPRPARPRLPHGFAWLIRLAPGTAAFGGQVRYLLADPDCFALLAAEPRARRILRPLCDMFGIEPSPDVPPSMFTPRPPRRRPGAEHPDPRQPASGPDAREPGGLIASTGSPTLA